MSKRFNGFLDGKNIYNESGAAIKLLIDNYGKNKLFEFLNKQKGISKNKELKSIFKEVYGSSLNYSFFNKLLK